MTKKESIKLLCELDGNKSEANYGEMTKKEAIQLLCQLDGNKSEANYGEMSEFYSDLTGHIAGEWAEGGTLSASKLFQRFYLDIETKAQKLQERMERAKARAARAAKGKRGGGR